MNATWAVVAAVGASTVLIKGAGPVLIAGRTLDRRLRQVLVLIAPAVLSALIATLTVSSGHRLAVDARAAGVGAAALCVLLRAPLLLTVATAAVVTALIRAIT